MSVSLYELGWKLVGILESFARLPASSTAAATPRTCLLGRILKPRHIVSVNNTSASVLMKVSEL